MRIAVVRHVLAYSRSSCKNAIFARCVHSRTSKRRSLYDVLDVSHSATQAEIKAAYYELSMKYHPDVNKSEEAQHKFTGLYITIFFTHSGLKNGHYLKITVPLKALSPICYFNIMTECEPQW